MKKTISERALKMLETHGWCQASARDRDGRICMSSAMHMASRRHGYAGRDLLNDLGNVLGVPETAFISWWNDLHNTKFDDVREALLVGASIELSNEA